MGNGATVAMIVGVISGTALTVVVNITSSDIAKTAVLAAEGAIVSFGITIALKWLFKHSKGKR